jgi:hypothetical protein
MGISTLFHKYSQFTLQTQLIPEFSNIVYTKQGGTMGTNLNKSSKGEQERKT